jgi:hypothetical protein
MRDMMRIAHRAVSSHDAAEWAARIERGLGSSGPPLSSMPVEHLTPAIEDRAVGSCRCWRTGASIVLRQSLSLDVPRRRARQAPEKAA